jgi:hypothetical protein
MRATEEQIRQGILHPERIVRDAALRYFAESFSQDTAVMPLAVRAIETYGWDDAFRQSYLLADLAQTDETLLWAIDQVNRVGHAKAYEDQQRCERLSPLIAQADVALVMTHEQQVLGLEGLGNRDRDTIAQRLRLTTLDTETCWQELEAFCEAGRSKQYISEVNLPHGERIAEALARDEANAERVLSILSQEIEDYDDNPMAWMEGLAVHMAGLMRLGAAVPLLIGKLKKDGGDYVNEQCLYAFPKIGTDSTVESICTDFTAAPWHYKLYASSSLARIHSDVTARRCLELLEKEEDGEIRDHLLGAVLDCFCSDGIEPARQLTLQGSLELRLELLAVSTLLGVSLPELQAWKEDQTKREKETQLRTDWLLGSTPPKPKAKPKAQSFDHLLQPPAPPPIFKKDQVGRNDPCPCGSGKKYKKCCMGK